MGRDYLYGEADNDVLVTEVQATVYGGDGHDVLIAQGTEENADNIILEGGSGNDQYIIQRSVGRISDNEGANVYNIETASGGRIYSLWSRNDDGQRDLLIVDINHDQLVASAPDGLSLALSHRGSLEMIATIHGWTEDASYRQLQVQTQDGHILEFDAQGKSTTVGYTIPGFTVEGGSPAPDFNAAADATFAQVTSITGDEQDNILTGNALNNYISGGAGRDSLYGGVGSDVLVDADAAASPDSEPTVNVNFVIRDLSEDLKIDGNFTNLLTGDFDGNGFSDLFRQEKGSWSEADKIRTAELLLSLGNGQFTRITLPESFALNGNFTNLLPGDFNGDGFTDILRQEKGSWSSDDKIRTAEVLLAIGNGQFTRITLPESFALNGNFTNLLPGDFNGDGFTDILRQEKGSWSSDDDYPTAEVLLSLGNGSFTRHTLPESFALKGDGTNLDIGDFNGDGFDDILRQEKGSWSSDDIRTAEVLLSQGNGSFTRHTLPESLALKGEDTNLYVKDLDGDGKAEILVQEKSAQESDTLRVLFSDDGSNFTEYPLPSALQVDGLSGQLHLADYNGSGQNDILVQYYEDRPGLIAFSGISRSSHGPDYLAGGADSDTYVLNGKLAIIDNEAADLATDKVRVNASASEISTALSPSGDLEISVGNEILARVENWSQGATYQHLEIQDRDNYILSLDSEGNATLTGRDLSGETDNQTYDAGPIRPIPP